VSDPRFDHLAAVEQVTAVCTRHAAKVDREGRYPAEPMEALASSGLLGLVSARDVGGQGAGIRAAAEVVERVARDCASTAMVLCMHYSGAAVIEKVGPAETRRELAAGRHLSTLAFSEEGSRSQFWAPTSTACRENGGIRLEARKSWVTAANHATAYVWSSRPLQGDQASTLWLVPRETAGIFPDPGFDGLGLRGNDSAPVAASGAWIPDGTRLGEDGGGFELMMSVVMPVFAVLSSACSLGVMESALVAASRHAAATQFAHLGSRVADLPTARAYLARMRIRADMARALWRDTLDALETSRADAGLRVLEVKAACGETALEVTDMAMRVCGGAAFRKEIAVERAFRDARAASVMAPTSDALFEFVGRAVCGMPLF
jgi:alkylation response protein AidB-like acyl-CoA dehydrogenase